MKTVERKTHVIDATDKTVGRLSTHIAFLLQGKGKTSFAPHLDIGDFVLVKNLKKLRFIGKKPKGKKYYRHSGYLGHLKTETIAQLFARRPQDVLRKAVLGMLPKNRLRPLWIKRLKVEL